MLHGRHGHAVHAAQDRAKRQIADGPEIARYVADAAAALNVEIIASVRFGWVQDQRNLGAAVDAGAFHDDIAIDC